MEEGMERVEGGDFERELRVIQICFRQTFVVFRLNFDEKRGIKYRGH